MIHRSMIADRQSMIDHRSSIIDHRSYIEAISFSADVANQKRGGVVPRAKIHFQGRKNDESFSFWLFF